MDVIKMRVDWDGDPLCRVADLEIPERATAHDEARVRAYTAAADFSVGEITLGNWCGRPWGGPAGRHGPHAHVGTCPQQA